MSELRIETYPMPAAELGPENPLPPLHTAQELHKVDHVDSAVPNEMRRNIAYGRVDNILPYTLQDGYSQERNPRDFRVAVLENETLKATFLLEFGGRLWSLYHKPAQRELLSVNPVFQPANLALRNAWFSGGVEWNIGTIGHSPFTCAPLFATRVDAPNDIPVLRMYEWERIRQVPFQIDAWLPDGSPVLFVRVRIINPHEREIPMYWWSNIAVPETPDTRVVIPADSAYRFNYDQLNVIPVPEFEDTDNTYAQQIKPSADYFFHIPDGHRPWITALDDEGKGLIQVSTPQLKGRKLFVWGMNSGGRKWQEFLSEPGEAYIEIQAGLARTQLEHLPMPAHTEWSWTEAYGLLETDPDAVHSANWQGAQNAVEGALGQLVSEKTLEIENQRGKAFENTSPSEFFQYGSGWGALEALRLKLSGKSSLSPLGLVFTEDSLEKDQSPWVGLLQNGVLPTSNPDSAPSSFIIQKEWKALLEESMQSPNGVNWHSWYQLGVMRASTGDQDGAIQAWEQSLQIAITPWALRNLAIYLLEDGQKFEAASLYIGALRLRPDLIPLAVECGKALLESNQAEKWLDLLGELPETVRTVGRIRLLEAQGALAVGNFTAVEQFFDNEVIIPDLREGEVSLSEIWYQFQMERIGQEEGLPLNDNLRERVQRNFPLPTHLDFRMK